MNCIVISLKKNFFTILFLLFTTSLILFSSSNLEAAKSGLILWSSSVLPSLFPFFIATELLYRTNFVNILGKFLTKFMRPIFNVPGESAICIILGTLSGYPMGAKLACNLKESQVCSKYEAERLLAFTNNSGPLFILGTVGASMFYSKEIGFLLLSTHLLAALTVGFLFRNWKKNKDDISKRFLEYSRKSENITFSNLGEILGESIKSSINLIMTIGGFIVLFSVIISICNNLNIFENLSNIFCYLGIPKDILTPIFSGILEITNGLKLSSSLQVKNLSINIIVSAIILGFGGISVMLQVYSVIAKHGLSIKPYIYGKCLQAIIAGFYTFIALQAFPIFTYAL